MNEEIYTYYQNTLCVYSAMLYEEGVLSETNYKAMLRRGHLIARRKGGNGRRALVEFDSMRTDVKKKLIKRYGNPYATQEIKLEDYIKPDPDAATYFSGYRKQDGLPLDPDTQLTYRTNAEIYNAVEELMQFFRIRINAKGSARRFSLKEFFEKIAVAIEQLPGSYKHSIGGHQRTIRRNFRRYKEEGYAGIIHGGFGNANSRVVNDAIESLLISIYCQSNKPYANWVHEDYIRFVTADIDVVDKSTGELFSRKRFLDDNGQPIIISEATVWNYISAPHNKPIIARYRSGAMEFQGKIRPHHNRSTPGFSLSKISMDDRDLPRLMHDGKRVKAYYAYDVKSGIVIGNSYSKRKDTDLFINCMRDMFNNIDNMGYGTPLEVEVEHHLVNNFRNDLMMAGNIFPFVRWANAGNAQEKWAETGNRLKKYGFEKRYQQGIGRFYSRLEANRTHSDKIFDEENTNYNEKKYDFEELIADDMHTIELYNNSVHPNKEYNGMTRMEVFKHYVNPDLPMMDKALLSKYIGVMTETSIRRNQYVQVNYQKFQIELDALAHLKPNNYQVEAYYLPHRPDKVYLYQGTQFICEAMKIVTYSTARAEWTDKDKQAYKDQSKYVKEFDTMVKDGRKRVAPIEMMDHVAFEIDKMPEIVPSTPEVPEDYDEFAELLSSYDEEHIKRLARESL